MNCPKLKSKDELETENDRLKIALQSMCTLWEGVAASFPYVLKEPKYIAAKYLLNNQ